MKIKELIPVLINLPEDVDFLLTEEQINQIKKILSEKILSQDAEILLLKQERAEILKGIV